MYYFVNEERSPLIDIFCSRVTNYWITFSVKQQQNWTLHVV